MVDVSVKDGGGEVLRGVDVGNNYQMPPFGAAEDVKIRFDNIPNTIFRDDDIMLLSYPKTGTHWLDEIIHMIRFKSTEIVKTHKFQTMLEAADSVKLTELASPRILNTHVNFRFIPKELSTRQIKTILVVRNPKSAVVSYYNFTKGMKKRNYSGEFKNYYPLWLQGKLAYGKYSDYLLEYERAISDGLGFPLHIVHYEDMKRNASNEIERLAKFLNIDLDDKLKDEIVTASSFDKMKETEKQSERKQFKEGFSMIRKGQISEWKEWFTVAENEQFDKEWNEQMRDSKLTFTYN